jgi:hypothetical protein
MLQCGLRAARVRICNCDMKSFRWLQGLRDCGLAVAAGLIESGTHRRRGAINCGDSPRRAFTYLILEVAGECRSTRV